MVHALRQRLGTLDDERRRLRAHIQQLEKRIEALYGELYAKRVDSSSHDC
jgi:chaperonin cofactor prefoldin